MSDPTPIAWLGDGNHSECTCWHRTTGTEDEPVAAHARHVAEAVAQAALVHIRAALANNPVCDVHPDVDPVTCGWKRAVADVQRALDREEADRG